MSRTLQLTILFLLFLQFCALAQDVQGQSAASYAKSLDVDTIADEQVKGIMFELDYNLRFYRKTENMTNSALASTPPLAVNLNFGYQNRAYPNGGFAIFGFWQGHRYRDDLLSLWDIGGRMLQPISKSFDLSISPGLISFQIDRS